MTVPRKLTITLAGGLLLWAAQRTPAEPYSPATAGEVQGFLLIDPAVPASGPAVEADGAKYSHLLRKIEVPADRESYGEFYDWGHWSGTSWAGHTDLPAGYWVYVDGWWYIFGSAAGAAPPDVAPSDAAWSAKGRAWGPEQATGAPDTPQAGDIQTAWASETPDDQSEWLELTYDQPIDAVAAMVHETFNPGAVTKIAVFDAEGNEHVVYEAPAEVLGTAAVEFLLGEGREGAVSGIVLLDAVAQQQRRTLVVPIKIGFPTQQVKVYLDSPAVPGWNEIDAVGLIDAQGNTHWASGATASSTYADRIEMNVHDQMSGNTDLLSIATPEDRLDQLAEEVRRLQAEVDRLRAESQMPLHYIDFDVAPPR